MNSTPAAELVRFEDERGPGIRLPDGKEFRPRPDHDGDWLLWPFVGREVSISLRADYAMSGDGGMIAWEGMLQPHPSGRDGLFMLITPLEREGFAVRFFSSDVVVWVFGVMRPASPIHVPQGGIIVP